MNEPRVLLLTGHDPARVRGGVETHARHLAEAFPRLEVVAADTLDPGLARGRFREFRAARALARWTVERHREDPLDLILANGSLAMALPPRGRDFAVPVVSIFHGDYAGYARAAMPPLSWRTAYARFAGARWERLGARRADVVVAVSSRTAREVARYYGREARVIPNGVPVPLRERDATAMRTRFGSPAGGPIVAFVGRATREKGYDRLLRIAARRPDIHFVLVVPEAPLKTPSNARVFADADAETVSAVLEAADALLFPSRFEGCAYAILEAMAAGTPVVTGATGAFSGAAGPFEGGWVVDGDRDDGWCATVDAVVSGRYRFDPRAWVRGRHSIERFVGVWRALAARLQSGPVPEVRVA